MFSILIVDDNPNDRKGILGLINWNDLGIRVADIASNGREGYQKAIELKPDFVLTDVAMPYMNGIEMTDKIKAELPDTKFIFMSCFDDVDYLISAINLEVSAYVLKPIELDELINAIEKLKNLKKNEISRANNEIELKKLLEESLPLLQEQFVKELLYGRLADENEIIDRVNYLNMDFLHKYYVVLFIQIDDYDLLYQNTPIEKKHFMIYSLQKCVEETIIAKNMGYATSQQYNSITVIKFFDSVSDEEPLDQLVDITNNCIEIVNNKLGINITIGISTFSTNLHELYVLFQNAEYAAKSKFYSKGNQIIFYSEVKKPNTVFQYNLQEIKQEIGSLIENGNEEDTVHLIEKYYTPGVQYQEKHIKSISYSIINIIQTILIENNKSFSDIFEDDMLIWRKLSLFETIVDIRQFLVNILNAVREIFTQSDSNAHQRIIEDIKGIIDTKYAEIENINQIVGSLFISASHANLIFKQSTGQTIFDYLICRRIEVAKKMLQDPYVKIYEIPEKIGYKANAHFRSVFKEFTGLTPKQYQDRYSNRG